MPLSRPVSLGVVAVLFLSLIAVFAVPAVLPTRVAAQADPTCVVSETNLVVNGSFESPVVTQAQIITPGGWSGAVAVYPNYTVDGSQYVGYLLDGLSQNLPTAGLAGATLTITFKTLGTANVPTLVVAGQPLAYAGPTFAHTATYTVPNPAPDTTQLAFGGTNFGGMATNQVDGVSVMVTACALIPTATATATTQPTATTAPTATATSAPTATATTVPTATATAVPTPAEITLTGGVQDGQTYARRRLPPAPTCTAVDDVDGPIACTQSGYETGFGTHTITYTATDSTGATATRQVTYTVAEQAVEPTATPRPPQPTPTLRPTARPRG